MCAYGAQPSAKIYNKHSFVRSSCGWSHRSVCHAAVAHCSRLHTTPPTWGDVRALGLLHQIDQVRDRKGRQQHAKQQHRSRHCEVDTDSNPQPVQVMPCCWQRCLYGNAQQHDEQATSWLAKRGRLHRWTTNRRGSAGQGGARQTVTGAL